MFGSTERILRVKAKGYDNDYMEDFFELFVVLYLKLIEVLLQNQALLLAFTLEKVQIVAQKQIDLIEETVGLVKEELS